MEDLDIKKNIKKDDIVWAKYKENYWPALIRGVNNKLNKVNIWYLDAPGKTFKVPFNHLKLFDDEAIVNKMKSQDLQNSILSKQKDIYTKVLIYLKKKANSDPDANDPSKYFNTRSSTGGVQSKQTLSLEEFVQEKEKHDKNKHTHNVIQSKKIKDSTSNDFETQIVECIKSGKTDEHLLKIKNGEINSERKTKFNKNIVARKRRISIFNLPFVKNYHKITELFNYTNKVCYKNSQNLFKQTDFVLGVLMPESIIKSLSLLKNISLCEAESLYKKETCNKDYESEINLGAQVIQNNEESEINLGAQVIQNNEESEIKPITLTENQDDSELDDLFTMVAEIKNKVETIKETFEKKILKTNCKTDVLNKVEFVVKQARVILDDFSQMLNTKRAEIEKDFEMTSLPGSCQNQMLGVNCTNVEEIDEMRGLTSSFQSEIENLPENSFPKLDQNQMLGITTEMENVLAMSSLPGSCQDQSFGVSSARISIKRKNEDSEDNDSHFNKNVCLM